MPRPLAFALIALALPLALCAEPTPAPLGARHAEPFTAGPAEAAARYAADDWTLVWHDEFDSGTAPSRDRWSYEQGMIRNDELQFYTADRRENARLADGCLVITARRESWGPASITSASLTTKGHQSFLYGKLEVRAKIPTGLGTWPAIWLLGDTDRAPWPRCGEIDIMENVGFDPTALHFTVHTEAFNHVKGTQRTKAVTLAHPWSAFHRYGLIWTPQKLEFFLDGEKVSEFANDGGGTAHWPFDAPENLILNFAFGGAWGGQHGVDRSVLPAEFRIDYVRYWQHHLPGAAAAGHGSGNQSREATSQ